MAETDFPALLEELVRRYHTRDAVGRLIGMSGSRVGRAINGEYKSFNIVNCLKLADRTGESASVILRAAGKGEIADLIERLYGGSGASLSRTDRALLDAWHDLNDDDLRDALSTVLTSVVAVRRAVRVATRTRKRSAS